MQLPTASCTISSRFRSTNRTLRLLELRRESSFLKYELGVPLVARPFGDDDALRAQREKRIGCRTHQHRIRIHLRARDGFHQVRLQQHGFSAEIQIEQSEAFSQFPFERSGV